ncbi:porin family protein [Flavivirga abyssicola]|uniref:porin family protein n=1 Tax=Flavivirga abyssicola TaxID=3063533 RepID=UPI0026DFE661|nr:porin family protein [Flavivirga sp. MEBiC07777]WVK15243.1 porin family protein [Flavivirga sp. MEBiC07777]
MKRLFIPVFFLMPFVYCFAQEINDKEVDSLYKEDQFYAGVTYNLLGNMPKDVAQSGFSLGFHLGFIKDMPINKNRNLAIGVGLGYSSNSFNQNLLVDKDDMGRTIYSVLKDNNTFIKNKFSSHLIELPIEFRWRTSTATEYNFWRIYTGFKLGYIFAHTTKYRGDLGRIRYTNIEDFNNFQYGLTLSAGYNTWNIFLYYALNPIFSSDANLDGNQIDMNAIKIGLMFYIL